MVKLGRPPVEVGAVKEGNPFVFFGVFSVTGSK